MDWSRGTNPTHPKLLHPKLSQRAWQGKFCFRKEPVVKACLDLILTDCPALSCYPKTQTQSRLVLLQAQWDFWGVLTAGQISGEHFPPQRPGQLLCSPSRENLDSPSPSSKEWTAGAINAVFWLAFSWFMVAQVSGGTICIPTVSHPQQSFALSCCDTSRTG